MANDHFTQPPVGVRRSLAASEVEQIITLLRLIEQLPLLSEPNACDSLQIAANQINTIQQNHRELAQWASSLLLDVSTQG